MTRVKRMTLEPLPEFEDRRFRQFLSTFVLFLLVTPVILWQADLFSIQTYFIVSFLWFLISSEIFAPQEPNARWWVRLRWIKLVGWIVFVYIIFDRVNAVV
jgi:hypothetical protein